MSKGKYSYRLEKAKYHVWFMYQDWPKGATPHYDYKTCETAEEARRYADDYINDGCTVAITKPVKLVVMEENNG